jgi:hypothetical protein
MSFTKTSIAAVTLAGFVASAASASACEWHNKQSLAKAPAPQAEEQADVSATPIDPMILARTESRDESEQIEKK